MKHVIKEGDLVTTQNQDYNTASNTYKVIRPKGAECLLQHPLTTDILVLKPQTDLNNVQASLQNSIEKCLVFAKEYDKFLSHTAKADLQAMIYFFVVKKLFTTKQRADIANICGKIASVILQSNIKAACDLITKELALLDDFLIPQYNNIEKIVKQPNLVKTKNERFTIFNIAGFLLAQGETHESA